EAETNKETGPLTYPEQGIFDIGAQHDSDTFHPMYGMLHEVRLYDRAVPLDELTRRFADKYDKFNEPIELETGPYLRFETPTTAHIRWETAGPMPTRLVLLDRGNSRRFEHDTPTTSHEMIVDDLPRDRMLHYYIEKYIEKEVDGVVSNTIELELDTHFNFSSPVIPEGAQPFKDDAAIASAAKSILNRCEFPRGVCLVIGNGDGRLAWELARQSDLRIIGVDTDTEKVAAAREAFIKAGVYGSRVAVHHVESYDKLPFVGRIANMIVSEKLLTIGKASLDMEEAFRVLRPEGGLICLGRPNGDETFDVDEVSRSLSAVGLEPQTTQDGSGTWITAVRPALEGAGEWSHLYGRADNSAFGGEELAGASTTGEMNIQWIGRPGPRAQPDRNGRKPSPLSTGGRLFVQGLHRIIALDAFNGTVLWALEIPSLERFNMPRDCSNWCADEQFVYIAAKDKCWQINAVTGDIEAFHPVVGGSREDWTYDWGFIAQTDNFVLGSAEKAGTAFVSFWGDAGAGWYDARSGPATFKVCSDAVFARRKSDGSPAWSYEEGVIINSTITVADGKLCFVESRHPDVKQS
ncbi:MAG: methyltransferase domain-containing protein, partial [Planctomycetaceae bacterium]|nr:methyltransferase domain-containing protein [Planctomycetaceae bacterium]